MTVSDIIISKQNIVRTSLFLS